MRGLERLHGEARGLVEEAEDRGWRLEVYDLRHDLRMPVFMATARADHPAFWVAAAAAPDPRRALEKALLELFQNHRWLARQETSAAVVPTTFEAHALHYALHPPGLPEGPLVDFSAIAPLEAPNLGAWLAARGFAPIACDLTTPDVRATGRHVIRAIVPGLVGIHADHRLPFLGSPRLGGARNPLPHPFP